MYKAGDFTNGKMNDIFKTAYSDDSVSISHKQLGEFRLSSKEADLQCLMTVLECTYGLFLDSKAGGGKVIRSVLCTDKLGFNIDTSLESYANSFNAEKLVSGLLLLSEKGWGKRLNTKDPIISLMRIASGNDCSVRVNYIGNANKKELLSSALGGKNSLSKDKANEFLADINQRVFNTVCKVIMGMAADSIQEHIIDTNCQPEYDWNQLKYCLIYFGVCDILGKVDQEHVEVCVQHLKNEGVISEIDLGEFGACENEFKINMPSVTI
jgi:hypothetical protein